MAVLYILLLLFAFEFLQLASSQSSCNTIFTFNGSLLSFSKCFSLPVQSASLAWTFYSNNNTLNIAFAGSAPSSSGWVGWGINPSGTTMVGSSVLVAFKASLNGSNVLPYQLTTEVQMQQTPLVCSPIKLTIYDSAVEISGKVMNIYASLRLPSNSTELNHVWNRGSSVLNFQPQPHGSSGDDLLGFQTINMFTAQATVQEAAPHDSLKRAHGIINTFSWGILLPVGGMFARYLRPLPSADPAWFYLHVCWQTLGYGLGVIGWALGMRLSRLSSLIHRSHQNIGISLFVLATLQVLSLFLRPGKKKKIRKWWNVYHHFLGYTVILLAVINIFQGLNILQPGGGWRGGYIASLCVMVVLCVGLEVATWIRFLNRRS